MAILKSTDVQTIRLRLNGAADTWTEDEVLAPHIVRPVEASVLRVYPDLDGSNDPDVRMALAMMVAAEHLRSEPEFTSSRLGDSQVTLETGAYRKMADAWTAQAWEMLAPVEDSDPDVGFLFGRIEGRR